MQSDVVCSDCMVAKQVETQEWLIPGKHRQNKNLSR